MKMLTALLILGISPFPAVVLVIDDFTRGVEEHRSAVDGLGTPRETADDSIFGGYRRSLANGFVRFRLVDGNVVAGDSSGFASVSVAGGFLNTTKTALTGVASMGYLGRSFTPVSYTHLTLPTIYSV